MRIKLLGVSNLGDLVMTWTQFVVKTLLRIEKIKNTIKKLLLKVSILFPLIYLRELFLPRTFDAPLNPGLRFLGPFDPEDLSPLPPS